MKHKGAMLKCERCSERAGEEIYFFSRLYAEHKRKPQMCPKCKQYSWDKKKMSSFHGRNKYKINVPLIWRDRK